MQELSVHNAVLSFRWTFPKQLPKSAILIKMPDGKGIDIALRYKGPDVEAGTMPVEDVVSALQGFAGAYGKIAKQRDPEVEHQLRVVALKTASFELFIGTWMLMLSDPGTQLKAFELVSGVSRWIVETIAKLIEAKKTGKGKPFSINVDGSNNTVILTNIEGATVTMTPDQFKIHESQMVDADLDKIADPLRLNHIDAVELTIADGTKKIEAEIGSAEREFFRPEETIVTTSRETEIDGTFVSLNKEKNSGTFRLKDGKGVPYHYSGAEEDRFHLDFSYHGPVRIKCTASLDDSLNPKRLDIQGVQRLQGTLPGME